MRDKYLKLGSKNRLAIAINILYTLIYDFMIQKIFSYFIVISKEQNDLLSQMMI